MRKDYRIAFWVFIIALFIGGALAVELANEKTQVHTIRSNEKVEKVHGNGSFRPMNQGFSLLLPILSDISLYNPL